MAPTGNQWQPVALPIIGPYFGYLIRTVDGPDIAETGQVQTLPGSLCIIRTK